MRERVANKLIAAAAGSGDDGGDDNFNLVTLRLDGDGTDQDDTTFSDSSGNSVSITRNGTSPMAVSVPMGIIGLFTLTAVKETNTYK